MTRRRVVVLASAATIFALGGIIAGIFATITQTDWGREKIRAYVEGFLNTKTKGKWHLGKIEGSLFSDIVVDSFSLGEPNDSAFVATGPVRIKFNATDLFDRRIVVSELTIDRAYVNVSEDSTKIWNFRRIFPPGPPGPPKPKTLTNWGDYIFVNKAQIKKLTFSLTMPWTPDDSLRGAKRDSAVTYALGRKDKDIRRSGSNFGITRTWTNASLVLGPSRVDDHNDIGRQFTVLRLDARESDPPFDFRNVRGHVRLLGDSLWTTISHFELPASVGTGSGKVWWGSDLPTRYDLTFVGDSVSLADVAWVYPTLPTTGGGKLKLRIHNESDPHVLDYVLSDMDVRTMKSRLRGSMTFATGAPVFIVKDVDVRTDPIDWIFIEKFTGVPLPYPWRGNIDATLKASGGPINKWRIDAGSFFFRDANVSGATASGKVKGELDMLHPALTIFHGFDVALDHLDLRTMQFLNPSFPRLNGTIAGTATLDSLWTDVRFRNADITHQYNGELPSRFKGNGRVTIGSKFLTYDMAVEAMPLNLTSIAHAWPDAALEFRGSYAGPIRLQGAIDDLAIGAELTGDVGTLAWDGRVDADSTDGYGYHGTLNFSSLNLRALYDTVSMPATALNGTAVVDIVGDSLRNYVGSVDLQLDRSMIDSTRLYSGTRTRLRFADERIHIDTVHVESAFGTFSGSGALGQRPWVSDSLVFAVSADSLGALRQYLIAAAANGDSAAMEHARSDSLQAEMFGRGTLVGSLDTLGVHAALEARGLRYGDYRAKVARLSAQLEDFTHPSIHGKVTLNADTLTLSTVAVSNVALDADVHGLEQTGYTLLTSLANGPVLESQGVVAVRGDTTSVEMAKLRLGLGDHEWKLDRPTTLLSHPGLFSLDTLKLKGSKGGEIRLAGTVPAQEEVRMRIAVDSVSLADIASLSQSNVAIGGSLSATLDITGRRGDPQMTLAGAITAAKVGQVSVARANLQGIYKSLRATGRLDVIRNDSVVVDLAASYPIDLALESRPTRVVPDTMRIAVKSDALDMRVVEGFTPSITNSSGRLTADMALSGPMGRATLNGFLRVDSVSANLPGAGIRIRDFNADLRAERDTLRIHRFSMVSGEELRDSLWLGGLTVLGNESPEFDLTMGARDFRIIGRKSIADLSVSTDLHLKGKLSGSELSGSMTVNRGFIVIPEFSEKEVISLEDFASYNLVDTTLFSNRSLLPKAPPAFVQNLTIRNVTIAMGPEVWLRSAEANINIGGAVNVIVGRRLGSTSAPQLALDGTLQTVRGTYRLALGPVQRTFSIERGDLRFFGDPDLNPVLDINAIHTVRQFTAGVGARNDVRIRVKVSGTLVRPRVSLQSADSLQLSESDLISYLVVGAPSFEITGLQNRSTYSNLFLGGLGSFLSSRLSGGLFDYVQIQTATRNASNIQGSYLFAGAQLGVGKQLGDRTFVSLTAGLCTFQQALAGNSQLSPSDIAQSLGATLEQQLARGYGFSFSLEPTTTAIFCSAQQTNRGFTANRTQVGFDLFRAWRW